MYCKNCGKEVKGKRVFCSTKCQRDFEYKSYIIRWKQGLEDGTRGKFSISNHIRRYLFEIHGSKCEVCGWGEVNPNTGLVPLDIVLNGNSSNAGKREILISRGVKEAKCECCGLSQWMGNPIPLELHHKDFNHYNNSLDNLQILCANCHMQAHNYNNNK